MNDQSVDLKPRNSNWFRPAGRLLTATVFIFAGINHFRKPTFYVRIIPPHFPNPKVLVLISGVCEIAGGIGLLVRRLRRAAGAGLIALLIAVFPANIYMAISPARFEDMHIPRWMLWVRLPLQVLLIVWVWFVSMAPARAASSRKDSRRFGVLRDT